MDQSCVDLKLL